MLELVLIIVVSVVCGLLPLAVIGWVHAKRSRFSCPTCRHSPALGRHWGCGDCDEHVDVFEHDACPACEVTWGDVLCLNCWNYADRWAWGGDRPGTIVATPRAVEPRCPYCLDHLLPDEERVRCARCGTPHHAECFKVNDGCVSFGCLSADEVDSGMSIFVRQEIKLGPPERTAVPLGPFRLSYRRLTVPSERPTSAPRARLLLETREVREGGRSLGTVRRR